MRGSSVSVSDEARLIVCGSVLARSREGRALRGRCAHRRCLRPRSRATFPTTARRRPPRRRGAPTRLRGAAAAAWGSPPPAFGRAERDGHTPPEDQRRSGDEPVHPPADGDQHADEEQGARRDRPEPAARQQRLHGSVLRVTGRGWVLGRRYRRRHRGCPGSGRCSPRRATSSARLPTGTATPTGRPPPRWAHDERADSALRRRPSARCRPADAASGQAPRPSGAAMHGDTRSRPTLETRPSSTSRSPPIVNAYPSRSRTTT